MTNINWIIPHPGGMGLCECESFKVAMDRWFEGFNIPRKVVNGKMEAFGVSHARVDRYLKEAKDG